MNTSKDKVFLLCIVVICPFAITASIEFLPWWIAAPIVFLSTIFWAGTMAQIGDGIKNKDDK